MGDTQAARSLLGLGLALVGCATPAPVVVLRSGVIHTMDASGTIEEAMVVRDGEIVYVGSDERTTRYEGPEATIVDLAGKAVLPGFHDAHTHLLFSGVDLLNVDVFSATTVDELVEAVASWAAANPEAEWVRGGGWSMSDFQGLLHKSQLDAVVPDRPVFLWSVDQHTVFANSRALELTGIGAATPDPEDGIIERDENGEPTGVLQEDAAYLVADLAPDYSDAQVDEGLANAQREANALGITTIMEVQVGEPWLLEGYARAEANGRLSLRVHAAIVVEPDDEGFVERLEAWRDEYESERLVIATAKLFPFSEERSGTLEEGKRADFIVVDRDPFEIPPAELSDVQVEQTWLDGEIVFESDES